MICISMFEMPGMSYGVDDDGISMLMYWPSECLMNIDGISMYDQMMGDGDEVDLMGQVFNAVHLCYSLFFLMECM